MLCSLASQLPLNALRVTPTQAATFAADAYFRAALAHKAEEKIGCELSRLKQAVAKLQEVRRAKPPPCPALEAMSALEALVLVEQNIATKDNQCVYMEPVRSPHNPTHLFFFSPPRSAVRATLAPPVHAAARFTLQPRMSASSQLLPFAQQRNAHVGTPRAKLARPAPPWM